MMAAYRLNGGLKSQRTTTANGSSWGSPVVITSNSNAKNPSLIYRPNDGSFFKVAWDDENNVYHQAYNGSGWASATTVSTGTVAMSHQFPSYALSGNNDRHIAWQAFEVDVYQKQAIYHNKNLTNVFMVFVSEDWNHFRPTASGHTGGALSVVCHDDSPSQNLLSRYFNGSSWQGGLTGTVIANNSVEASLSITNPAGATAKAVWRSAGNAPYTLTIGPSGGLGKINADDPYVYHRRIVYSLANQNALSLQITAAEIVAAGSRNKIQFPNIADNVSVSTSQLAETMHFSNIMLPANADSVVFTVRLYSREAGGLRQSLQQPAQAAFTLSHANTGLALATISLPALPISGEFRQKVRVAFPVQTWRGQAVNLQPILANLDQNKSEGALLHVYEFDPANAKKNGDQLVEAIPANPQRFEFRVHPNPFNTTTRIYFSLPTAGAISMRIYDVNGRTVYVWKNEPFNAGEHALIWDGNDQHGLPATSGTYFAEMVIGAERRVAKMLLLR